MAEKNTFILLDPSLFDEIRRYVQGGDNKMNYLFGNFTKSTPSRPKEGITSGWSDIVKDPLIKETLDSLETNQYTSVKGDEYRLQCIIAQGGQPEECQRFSWNFNEKKKKHVINLCLPFGVLKNQEQTKRSDGAYYRTLRLNIHLQSTKPNSLLYPQDAIVIKKCDDLIPPICTKLREFEAEFKASRYKTIENVEWIMEEGQIYAKQDGDKYYNKYEYKKKSDSWYIA